MKRYSLILGLLVSLSLLAGPPQTAVFNGKTYFVYPHRVQTGHNSSLYFNDMEFELDKINYNESDLIYLKGLHIPPVLEALPDGDYLIYHAVSCHRKRSPFRKRHKQKQVCDSFKVYATVHLTKSKKEGEARLYHYKDQNQVIATLNYKNDLLHGSCSATGKYKDRQRTFHFNMHEGYVDGVLKTYLIKKKDTSLIIQAKLNRGRLDGEYFCLDFGFWRKFYIRDSIHGFFKEGARHGKWTAHDFVESGNVQKTNYYDSGVLLMSAYGPYNNGQRDLVLYGKDSIAKYFPDYQNAVTSPFVPGNNSSTGGISSSKIYHSNPDGLYYYDLIKKSKDMIVLSFKNDQMQIPLFIHNNRIYKENRESKAFMWYTQNSMAKVWRDSIVAQDTFRIVDVFSWKNRYIYTKTYIIKTHPYHFKYGNKDSGLFYTAILATTVTPQKKGPNKVEIEDYFKLNYLSDTLKPFLQYGSKSRKKEYQRFTYYPLHYTFSDYVYKKRNRAYLTVKHHFSGSADSVLAVKETRYLIGRDTFSIVDTVIYQGRILENYVSYLGEFYTTYINKYMPRSMDLNPIQHKSFTFKGHKYTGLVVTDISYRGRRTKYKGGLKRIKYSENGKYIHLKMRLSKAIEKVDRSESFVMPFKNISMYFDQGRLDGNMIIKTLNNDWMTLNFNHNKLNNVVEIPIYKSAKSIKRSRKHMQYSFRQHRFKRSYYYSNDKRIRKVSMMSKVRYEYRMGKREGNWQLLGTSNEYRENFRLAQYDLSYQKDSLTGIQTIESQYGKKFHFQTDRNLLDGKFYEYNAYGQIDNWISYHRGQLHGPAEFYINNSSKKEHVLIKTMALDSSVIVQTKDYFKESGKLKKKVEFDTSFMPADSLKTPRNYKYKFLPDLDGRPGSYDGMDWRLRNQEVISGMSTAYYLNGDVFKSGFIWNGKPFGVWKIYREKQSLYKLIEIKDSVVYFDQQDSLRLYNAISAYYGNGQLMYRGYAMNSASKYSCESEQSMPTESIFYLSFFDSSGKSLLQEGNGTIQEFQAGGHKLCEGQIKNYKKEGLWVVYDKFGHAESIGFYVNGQKNGRWLEGDLSGVNLPDNICFMNQEEFNNWIKFNSKNFRITEKFYRDGEYVGSSWINIEKN